VYTDYEIESDKDFPGYVFFGEYTNGLVKVEIGRNVIGIISGKDRHSLNRDTRVVAVPKEAIEGKTGAAVREAIANRTIPGMRMSYQLFDAYGWVSYCDIRSRVVVRLRIDGWDGDSPVYFSTLKRTPSRQETEGINLIAGAVIVVALLSSGLYLFIRRRRIKKLAPTQST
jgi:hypothetical protein